MTTPKQSPASACTPLHEEREQRAGEPVLLRVEEAAGLLRVSRSTVYELLAAGELPSLTIGTGRRIPLAGLKEWIAARTVLGIGSSTATVSERSDCSPTAKMRWNAPTPAEGDESPGCGNNSHGGTDERPPTAGHARQFSS